MLHISAKGQSLAPQHHSSSLDIQTLDSHVGKKSLHGCQSNSCSFDPLPISLIKMGRSIELATALLITAYVPEAYTGIGSILTVLIKPQCLFVHL